jgi:6-phosphogluconolactonase
VSHSSGNSAQWAVIGCYTPDVGGSGVGLTLARRDPQTGALHPTGPATPTPAPSFVVRHPTHPVLYAVNELDDGQVSAFALADEGPLTPLGSWPTGGQFPCHLTLEPAGRHLLVANYGSGSVASLALDADGVPTHRAGLVEHSGTGADPQRQEGPHAHHVHASADGVLAVDLGVDRIYRYRVDPASGQLGPGEIAATLPPGTGPRHFAVAGDDLYLVGELAGTITTFRAGAPVSTVASSTNSGTLPSEIGVAGGYLYVANRGPDTLATFALTGDAPTLVAEVPTGGAWPRHFAIDGRYLYVANERSHTVVCFVLDPETGVPTPTGDVLATPSPTCVLLWDE